MAQNGSTCVFSLAIQRRILILRTKSPPSRRLTFHAHLTILAKVSHYQKLPTIQNPTESISLLVDAPCQTSMVPKALYTPGPQNMVQSAQGVSPDGRTYRRCKYLAEEIYGFWIDITGSPPELHEMHHGISQSVMPTLIDEYEGIGSWLISCRESMQPHTMYAANAMAYLFTLLEQRWQIVSVGRLLNQCDIIVAGPLSGSELSDLARGVFPITLSYFGKPGYRFSASGRLARRMSAPALKLGQHVESTAGEGSGEAQDDYRSDNDLSQDTGREDRSSRLYPPTTLTTPTIPLRRGFSESALPSLKAFKRRESTWKTAR